MSYDKNSIEFVPKPTIHNFIDIEGRSFGRLTVLGFGGYERFPSRTATFWWCECECGNIVRARADGLRNGNIRSCKCLQRQVSIESHRKPQTYSPRPHSRRTQRIWRHMMNRCTKPTDVAFVHYGGRGITVSDKWQTFDGFLEDMGDAPPRYTLERIDNDKGYSVENCKWATRREQANNTRRNKYIIFEGRRQTIAQWAREKQMPPYLIYRRISAGWTPERALTTPQPMS